MEKEITGFPDYTVDEYGNIYSYKKGCRTQLKQWKYPNGYIGVNLCVDGRRETKLVHRLVAKEFVQNPNGYNVVNHIDKNITNNNAKNLEWCSTQYNVNYSYTKENNRAVRNHIKCKLVDAKDLSEIGSFESIKSACRYASNFLGCSFTGMERNRISNGYRIIIDEGVTTN